MKEGDVCKRKRIPQGLIISECLMRRAIDPDLVEAFIALCEAIEQGAIVGSRGDGVDIPEPMDEEEES